MTADKKGFTLIELLVVIAIIAILAAILFPVFLTAKQTAASAACLSNLKQLGTAAQLYLQDSNERYTMIPPIAPAVGDTYGWAFDGIDVVKSAMQIGYVRKYSIQALFQRYLKNKGVWKCPADALCAPDVVVGKRWTSYPFRNFIVCGSLSWVSGWPMDQWYKGNGWAPFPTSKFPTPTRTFIFNEQIPFHTLAGINIGQADMKDKMKIGAPQMNFAFMDGHVGRFSMSRVCHWAKDIQLWDYAWPDGHWDGKFIDFGCPYCEKEGD